MIWDSIPKNTCVGTLILSILQKEKVDINLMVSAYFYWQTAY